MTCRPRPPSRAAPRSRMALARGRRPRAACCRAAVRGGLRWSRTSCREPVRRRHPRVVVLRRWASRRERWRGRAPPRCAVGHVVLLALARRLAPAGRTPGVASGPCGVAFGRAVGARSVGLVLYGFDRVRDRRGVVAAIVLTRWPRPGDDVWRPSRSRADLDRARLVVLAVACGGGGAGDRGVLLPRDPLPIDPGPYGVLARRDRLALALRRGPLRGSARVADALAAADRDGRHGLGLALDLRTARRTSLAPIAAHIAFNVVGVALIFAWPSGRLSRVAGVARVPERGLVRRPSSTQINGSEEYGWPRPTGRATSRSVIEAEPDRGVPDDVWGYLDLWHGACRGGGVDRRRRRADAPRT